METLGLSQDASSRDALDIDVVDGTWMDANVHSIRHNYFNINRWLVDDLREIFVTQKRASQRTSRMIHRGGNVYNFLAAPAHVVND